MAEASAALWLKQAENDFAAAARLFDSAQGATFCQAIAKYQQTVEKSIKAVVASLRDARALGGGPWYAHDLKKEMDALKRLLAKGGGQDVVKSLRSLLAAQNRSDLKTLCDLAPEKPEPGGLTRRNTEYPFQRPDETWTAPAEDDAFTQEETERFRLAASRNLEGARRIVSLLERTNR